MNTETKERTRSQRSIILNRLREAGTNGLTNVQLSDIALRYNARLQELYTQGYEVKVEPFNDGITKYTLVFEPEILNKKLDDAINILFKEIKNTYQDKINTEDLANLLERQGFTVRRKIGSFNKLSNVQ